MGTLFQQDPEFLEIFLVYDLKLETVTVSLSPFSNGQVRPDDFRDAMDCFQLPFFREKNLDF